MMDFQNRSLSSLRQCVLNRSGLAPLSNTDQNGFETQFFNCVEKIGRETAKSQSTIGLHQSNSVGEPNSAKSAVGELLETAFLQ